jgi:hypothetical protein
MLAVVVLVALVLAVVASDKDFVGAVVICPVDKADVGFG